MKSEYTWDKISGGTIQRNVDLRKLIIVGLTDFIIILPERGLGYL